MELRLREAARGLFAGDAADGQRRRRRLSPRLWLLAMLRDLTAALAIGKLSPILVSSRSHDPLLIHHRNRFIRERVKVVSIVLALATIAWIPNDLILFRGDLAVVIPLAVGRFVAAALFLAAGRFQLRGAVERSGIRSIWMLLGVGIAFYTFAHAAMSFAGDAHFNSPAHSQYLLLPIVLVAGLSIFPLTLGEVVPLFIAPLLSLTIELLLNEGDSEFWHVGINLLMLCAIMATTTVCSVSQLKLLADVHERSIIDALTGVLSRRAGVELLKISFAASRRADTPFSLVLLDLDRFKPVNDEFGHEAGDRVLRDLAHRLARRLRSQDAVVRWGGEEFVLVLPNTRAEQATALVAELFRSDGALRPDGSVQTVSAGLSERQADAARSWRQLVKIADERMYAAKRGGRNRLHTAGSASRCLNGGDADATEFREAPTLVPGEGVAPLSSPAATHGEAG